MNREPEGNKKGQYMTSSVTCGIGARKFETHSNIASKIELYLEKLERDLRDIPLIETDSLQTIRKVLKIA